MGRAGRALLALLVAALLLPGWLFAAAPAGAQGGNQVLIWHSGSDFAVFGGNETIEINIGGFDYVTDCGAFGGIVDNFGLFAADIYILPSGDLPVEFGQLQDAGGSPNTISGVGTAFTDRVIGFAKPQGEVPPGRYAIVYDECQNGVLDEYDAVFDPAFEVVIDPNVPPLPNNEMFIIKERAAYQAAAWQEIAYKTLALFAVVDALDAMGAANTFDFLLFAEQAARMAAFNAAGYQDPKDAAVVNLINKVRQYNALANDPPDPDFAETVTLGERAIIDPQSSDPLILALIGLGNVAATEGAQVEALIHALEKYQGTEAAGPGEHRGEWAAAHARAAQTYATGLSAQLGETDTALAALAAALATDTRPIDAALADLEARRAAIIANGFGDEELKALRALGLTDADLATLQTNLGTTSFAGTEADLVADINAARGEIASTQAAFDGLAGAMTPIISTLAAAGTDDHPSVDAGGPYSGTVGAAVAFDGSATGTFPIVSYEWDLDADDDFDDAPGATAGRTYDTPFTGLVGLRATNSAGRVGIAYAPLTVTGGNGRPQITASSPTTAPTLIVGAAQAFNVAASDPDGDPVTVTWTLDGMQVGTGADYTLTATPYNLGFRTLVATASDGEAFGTARRVWSVSILAPDADGDGWRANVDCGDSDPQAGYCPAQPVPPDPANALTITSTGDAADCPNGPGGAGYTLRCAITDANAAGAGKTIAFDVPASDPGCDASGVCTIALVDGGNVLPALTASNTVIDGYTQPGASPNTNGPDQGTNAAIKIHIRGLYNTFGLNAGINVAGNGNTVRGLAITEFFSNRSFSTYGGYRRGGIYVSGDNNRIVGNSIGLLPGGAAPGTKNIFGINIYRGNRNVIGGSAPADRNVISWSNTHGVTIQRDGGNTPTGNIVIGNLIGTDPAGTSAIRNGAGIGLSQTRESMIGGTAAGERNIISGNGTGIEINDHISGGTYTEGGSEIRGNYVGLDVTGAVALGDQGDGIDAVSSVRLVVTDNVISGNGSIAQGSAWGISLVGCLNCRIVGNRIGTNAAGTTALGNGRGGLFIEGSEIVVGGAKPGEGNLISGNGGNGIQLGAVSPYASNPVIVGNRIGTDITGTLAFGNGLFGIFLTAGGGFPATSVATIGGVLPGEGNLIANNLSGGIGIGNAALPNFNPSPGTLLRDLVRGNAIHSNGGLGIDLQPGATVNCAEPTQDGPNAYLHCPAIRAVTTSTVSGTGPTGATVDVYLVGGTPDPSGHGEASAYLGSATVHGCGNTWTLAGLALPPGAAVTATASILDGPNRGTSEFGANVAVGTVDPLFVPTVTAAADQQAETGVAATLDLGSVADGCNLGPYDIAVDWGDGSADTTFALAAPGALGTRAHTYTLGGAKTVTVTVTNSAGGSASTTFAVTLPAPALAIASLGATTLPEGSAAYALTVTGTGFAEGMVVRWNGDNRATTFVSATELTAQITAADLADSGTASVTVHDGTSSLTSNALTFTISNASPTATFTAPASVAVGAGIALALTGATDPSPADLAAGLTFAFDCGDGTGYGAFGSTSTASCPTSATGNRAVKGTVRDQDGGEREYTATVQVVALPAALLVVAAASGPYDGTAALSATLTLAGQPLAGKTVAFALDGAAAGSATTDGNGLATIASASLAGIAVGTYPSGVTATYAGEAGQHLGDQGTAALTVGQADQTIDFAPLGDRVLGSGTFAVSATATSGLAVTFAASGGNCTTAGATVTLVAVGGCTITASQAGNANYHGATDVARTFQIVAPATGLTALAATGTYGGTATLTATLLGDGDQPLVSKTIAFTLNGNPVGSAVTDANGVAMLPGISLDGLAAGSYPAAVGADFAGDDDFAASEDTATLTIAKAALTITADDATRQYGAANPAFAATYSGFVGGETPAVLTGALTCTATATSASAPGTYPIACTGLAADNYAIGYVNGTLTVTKADQTITFAALADRQLGTSPFAVSASATSGLAVVFAASGACTVSGTSVTLSGPGTCTITASQAGDANYSAAPTVARTFAITTAPPAQVTLALTVVGGAVRVAPAGTDSTGGSFGFDAGTPVTLTALPGANQVFTGWLMDGTIAGWAPSLSITMQGSHAVQATFVVVPTFPDVPGARDDSAAIAALAARGTIRGYLGGSFGPDDRVSRAQMAALIARATPAGPDTPPTALAPNACLVAGSWDCEDWGNDFRDRGGLDANLWRNVGTLQHYLTAHGYDGAACAARGVPAPCFAPNDEVSYAQTIAFITRAMVAKGYWAWQPVGPTPPAGVPAGHDRDLRTFLFYTGGTPALPSDTGWNDGATRGWFAQALWAALDSYWGVDGTLPDGQPAGGFVP